jgi:Family of unknown function (DUF5719)
MRRIAAVAVIAALAVLAFMQPKPAPDTAGLGFEVPVDPGGAVGEESVWYCPWVASGAVRDSSFNVASGVDVEATITLPNPNPTLEADTVTFQLQGADARSVDTSEIVRRGESPGIVEFDDGPAVATTAMWTDELLTGDKCVQSVPKVWHLVGGTTAEGFTLQLRLFNPFPEAAKVTVESISEFGSSPLGAFEGLDVPGRSWLTEDLTRVIPFLDNVTLTVRTETGLVIPALVLSDEADEATWNGIGQSSTWDFPVTSVPGLDPSLVLSNTGEVPANVVIDVFSPGGPTLEAASLLVSPNEPIRVELADFADPPFGIRVVSNVPLGAVIQAAPPGAFPRAEPVPGEGDEEPPDSNAGAGDQGGGGAQPPEAPQFVGLASTTGTTDPATRWIIPGLGVVPAADTSLWIINPSGDQATVTITPLGAATTGPDKILVAPGSQVEIAYGEFTESGTSGVIIDATVPIDAGVSIAGPSGVALIGGIPVG